MSLEGGTSAIASPPQLIHKLMKPEQAEKINHYSTRSEVNLIGLPE